MLQRDSKGEFGRKRTLSNTVCDCLFTRAFIVCVCMYDKEKEFVLESDSVE